MNSVTNLPLAFLQRVDELLGPADRAAWERSLERPPLAVRWTGCPDRIQDGRDYLEQHGLSPRDIPWCVDAWHLEAASRSVVSALSWVETQALFVQSLSSIAAVEAMHIEPGHDVLDLCAAPGAKTSLIRRRQGPGGVLVANDLSRARTRRLRALLKRLEITGVEVLTGPGEQLGSTHERCFDRVLVDAPCSGEGRFRPDDPGSWSRWSESAIRRLAIRQEALLESACRAARPGGGEVLYATCTMAPEENERVVDRVLARGRTPVELVSIDLSLAEARPGLTTWRDAEFQPTLRRAVRIVGSGGMTPFFMARMRRVD